MISKTNSEYFKHFKCFCGRGDLIYSFSKSIRKQFHIVFKIKKKQYIKHTTLSCSTSCLKRLVLSHGQTIENDKCFLTVAHRKSTQKPLSYLITGVNILFWIIPPKKVIMNVLNQRMALLRSKTEKSNVLVHISIWLYTY